jgi:hypothetical protein
MLVTQNVFGKGGFPHGADLIIKNAMIYRYEIIRNRKMKGAWK